MPERIKNNNDFEVSCSIPFMPLQANRLSQTSTNTTLVRMDNPKSELILLMPNLASTEVSPAKNVANKA
jgi:hypothetical protein